MHRIRGIFVALLASLALASVAGAQSIAGTVRDTSGAVLPGVNVEVISTPHRRESLALRLADGAGTILVYTSDTGFSETLAEFARGATLLILECSFYRHKPAPKHLELAEAMRIAQLAKPRRLLLTHLYPEWDDVDLESEARKLWAGETIAACDGLRLQLDP